jgi:large subunit ribosomal protein L28e
VRERKSDADLGPFLYRIYKGVASKTAQNGYRADLREEAVARVSAVRRSQKAKKETTPRKPRGSKAVQAAEKAE